MRLKLISWNGHNINDGTNYEAVIQPGNAMPSAIATFIDMGQSNPILAGKTIDGGYFTLHIILRGNIETQRDELNEWFRVDDFTTHQLIAYDLDDSNRSWYLEGYPVTPPMLSDSSVAKYSVTLALSSPYWIESIENSTLWSVDSATETQVITNRGNVAALPIFEIEPQLTKGASLIATRIFAGIRHSGWVDVAAQNTIPIDLTPSGFNTQTPIAGGQMQADGNDIVVTIDGAPVYRWFTGINTTTTHIWVNVTFSLAPALTLQTTLDNSTLPTTITCSYTDTTISLPQNSTLQIGTEFFTYSTYTVDTINKTVTFTMVTRGSKESTKAAHSIGDTAYWIEHDIWITYGNAAATAPTQDDTQKPSMTLASSTNSLWVWSNFSNLPANAGFNSPLFRGAATKFTDEDAAGGMVSPYEVMGIQLASVQVGNVVYQLNVWGSVNVVHPGKVSRVVCSIEKWRNSANFGTLKLYAGDTEQTLASPASASTWTAESVDLTSLSPNISAKLDFRGMLGTTLPVPIARVQMFSMSVYINTAPTITLITASTAYDLSPVLENETTGDGIQLSSIATKLDEITTIDCEDMEAYKADGTRLRGQLVFLGDARDEWMTLEPGANTLRYTDANTNGVNVTVRWRGRNTI